MDVLKYQPVIQKSLIQQKIRRSHREDMTQECYVALLENPDRLSGPDDETQAALICRSRIEEILKQRIKKQDRPKLLSADDPSVARQLDKITSINEGNISESELYAAITDLRDDDREVIKLRFIEGLTQQQTCGRLELTLEEMKWRQERGIKALKKYFEVEP